MSLRIAKALSPALSLRELLVVVLESSAMKRTKLIVACLLLSLTGCTCGQGWNWRPGMYIGQLHNRIHGVGNNIGEPCMSGACAAPAMVAPVGMADAGCTNCGGVQHMGYEGYPSQSEGVIVGSSYGSPVENLGGMVSGNSYPMPENIVPRRAQ
jgi:hypothetical protein